MIRSSLVNRYLVVLALAFACIIAGCASRERASTPKEFVEQYSEAWKRGNVEDILAMQVRKKFVDRKVPEGITVPVEEYWAQTEREEVEKSIRQNDLFAQAWASTSYVAERVHEDHIHVDVLVAGIGSSIVLVRDGEVLKIHPEPSSFP